MAVTHFSDEVIQNMQQKGLDMLLYFKEICDKNNLMFYFCGGCCIGAVRDGGFIPWDDDVDVFMPRPDYEKLLEIWDSVSTNERYFLQYTTKEKLTKNLFATLCDSETTYIKTYQKNLDINHGIALDILPLDGCPTKSLARKLQKINAIIYSLYLLDEPPMNHGAVIKTIGRIMLAVVPKRLKYRIWRSAEKRMSRYPFYKSERITELCSGPDYMQNEYYFEDFKSAVYYNFEGYKMPLPVGFDRYLRTAFGDYTELPPPEKRIIHHEIEFCDVNNSYKKYKHKYYCTK
ncbi:MAG: LicD family protein [Clostridia bacterium]|nr:LicD family protein [Clostridia bacterium]